MPSTRLITEIRLPESLKPSVLNSTVVFGVKRSVLPSSNSISARPRSCVLTCGPCVIGRVRNAFSNPQPVFLSIGTEPCTSLRRTMRACELARAGSARRAQAAKVRATMLNLERERLDIATSKDRRCLLDHGFPGGSCKIWPLPYSSRYAGTGGPHPPAGRQREARGDNRLAPRSRTRTHFHNPLRPCPHDVHHRAIVINLLQNRLHGLQFDEIPSPGLIFHALQLVIEGKLLVAMGVG